MNKRNIGIALTILSILVLIGAWLVSPHRHTLFANGYTADRFDRVKTGNQSGRVRDLLGTPMSTTTDANGFQYWHYSQPEASPNHMISRCVVIKDGRVARLIHETRWDPRSHQTSGGSLFKKVAAKK